MSVVERAPRVTVAGEQRQLCGWGRTRRVDARVLRPTSLAQAVDLLAGGLGSERGLIARGAARSYGDAAQLEGGDVLDTTALGGIAAIDTARCTATVQAGVTVAQLMARLASDGLTLPVVPGTRFVTIAGAIASDIHGKNHHRDGGFARHVHSLSLWTPAGGVLEVSPESDPELFYGTLGGMGLTGIVLEATLAVERLACPWVAADVDRTDSLEQTLELLGTDERHRYSVAWLDLLAPGAGMGRAVISQADPLPAAEAPRRRARTPAATLARGPVLDVPRGVPAGVLRPRAMRAFNAARWHASPRRARRRPLKLAPYFFPLDALGAWNRLYGPAGFVQYQLVIPSGEEAALRRCFELIGSRRLPVYLAVFKRFGAEFGGPLSFPLQGWTLAMDLPAAAAGLERALRELDEIVAGCGGRVYLTKDARLAPETVAAMYPRLHEFAALRARCDPGERLRSDLGRRVGLCGTAR
ncbi:MAG: decaprenylphospho-beta-D-ribofuranose 2-oxidase [Solirubrobacteraceae bacterium]|jgi:decaprenylphospho-beta-D-ribofuranose 2-oxidase|nr:decaprenylphospho-beta-D-ribofuranose 2-oxidase [Solirubrobacteraceae bacterium]